MSFFSDLGSIAREFNQIKDDLSGTLNETVADATSAANKAYGDITASAKSLSADANAASQQAVDAVKKVKQIDIRQSIEGITSSKSLRKDNE